MRKLTVKKTQEAKHLTLEATAMAAGGNSIRYDPLTVPPPAHLFGGGTSGSGGGKSSSNNASGANDSVSGG